MRKKCKISIMQTCTVNVHASYWACVVSGGNWFNNKNINKFKYRFDLSTFQSVYSQEYEQCITSDNWCS